MNNNIAAGIVMYNPNKERLNMCLSKIEDQVDKIYLFDNSNSYFEQKDNIVYLSEGENKGIAYALNRIMENAKKDGYNWIITMDQDSIIPDGMIADFRMAIISHPEVGIVCPQVIDKRRAYLVVNDKLDSEYIEFCITSASCTSIDVWEKCGKFDEWMFIDLVDNDFCKRLVLSGYKILRLNKWVLDQEFGQIIPKNRKKQKFWIMMSKVLHNQNIAKFSYKKIVSPLRVYYTNRNIIYLNKKMKEYGNVGYENYNCKGYFGFIISFMLPSILRAQEKRKVIKATIDGVIDGVKSQPIRWKM